VTEEQRKDKEEREKVKKKQNGKGKRKNLINGGPYMSMTCSTF
jgi:hypothetical protein